VLNNYNFQFKDFFICNIKGKIKENLLSFMSMGDAFLFCFVRQDRGHSDSIPLFCGQHWLPKYWEFPRSFLLEDKKLNQSL
jgi:hypothetical protein